jgi:hypothetical protein
VHTHKKQRNQDYNAEKADLDSSHQHPPFSEYGSTATQRIRAERPYLHKDSRFAAYIEHRVLLSLSFGDYYSRMIFMALLSV